MKRTRVNGKLGSLNKLTENKRLTKSILWDKVIEKIKNTIMKMTGVSRFYIFGWYK